MEDEAVVRSDGLDGFSFAAVFDGHAGFSSVKFLRWVSNEQKVFVFMFSPSLLLLPVWLMSSFEGSVYSFFSIFFPLTEK